MEHMGLFRIALKVAEPITLLAFCAALCFRYFRDRTSKSIDALASLPEHDRKDALAVLHAGVIPTLLKEATPEQLAEFNKNFESRQRTIRFFAILAASVFILIFATQVTFGEYSAPPKPPQPEILNLYCAERYGDNPKAPLLRVSLGSLTDRYRTFHTFVRASKGRFPLFLNIGQIQITNSSEAEFFLDGVPRRIYVRTEIEDVYGRVLRRSSPAMMTISESTMNC